MAQLPDQETLQALLHYEPDTGRLFWKERPREMFKSEGQQKKWNNRYAGAEALTARQTHGYLHGAILGRKYRAHRVIWKLVHGVEPEQVDHINGDVSDNRLGNLRDVSHQTNGRNQKRSARNSSGVVGVSRHKVSGKWTAAIKGEYLGLFEDFEEAVAVRKAAEIEHGFHPNHGRRQ